MTKLLWPDGGRIYGRGSHWTNLFFLYSGVQFENKTYVIPLITWSKKITYYKGTRISYVNDYESPDLLEIDGPTNVPLKIVVIT